MSSMVVDRFLTADQRSYVNSLHKKSPVSTLFSSRGCRLLPPIPSVASRRVSGEGCVFSSNDLLAAPVPTSHLLVLPLCGIIQNEIGNVYFRVCPRLQITPRPFSPPVPSRAIPCRALSTSSGVQRPYRSQPSRTPVGRSWLLDSSEPVTSDGANSLRNSCLSHSSSSSFSSSDGFMRPPTFDLRSKSACCLAASSFSFSTWYNSALSPAYSFIEMRKSRR